MGYVYPYLACFAFLILWSRLPDPTGPDNVRNLEEPMKLRVSYKQNIGAQTAHRWTDEFEVRSTQVVHEIGTLLDNARDEGYEITKILIERDALHEIGDFAMRSTPPARAGAATVPVAGGPSNRA